MASASALLLLGSFSVALAQTGISQTADQATTKKPAAESTPAGQGSGAEMSSPFGAFTSTNHGPINIQSQTLSLDYKRNAVTFTGAVHATQGNGALTSDTLNVKYGKDFHQVQTMVADGHVHMSQGVQWCISDHANMDQDKHILVLTGSPVCHDAKDEIAGTKITVHLDTGKSYVESAKAVIFPQESKTRDNEPSADHVK